MVAEAHAAEAASPADAVFYTPQHNDGVMYKTWDKSDVKCPSVQIILHYFNQWWCAGTVICLE